MSLSFAIIVISLFTYLPHVVSGLKCPGKCVDDPGSCRLLGGKILGYCFNEQVCCDCEFPNQNRAIPSLNTPSIIIINFF